MVILPFSLTSSRRAHSNWIPDRMIVTNLVKKHMQQHTCMVSDANQSFTRLQIQQYGLCAKCVVCSLPTVIQMEYFSNRMLPCARLGFVSVLQEITHSSFRSFVQINPDYSVQWCSAYNSCTCLFWLTATPINVLLYAWICACPCFQ